MTYFSFGIRDTLFTGAEMITRKSITAGKAVELLASDEVTYHIYLGEVNKIDAVNRKFGAETLIHESKLRRKADNSLDVNLNLSLNVGDKLVVCGTKGLIPTERNYADFEVDEAVYSFAVYEVRASKFNCGID